MLILSGGMNFVPFEKNSKNSFFKIPMKRSKNGQNFQCLKTLQICYLRHAEHHAKNRTSLRGLDHDTLFLNDPLFPHTKLGIFVKDSFKNNEGTTSHKLYGSLSLPCTASRYRFHFHIIILHSQFHSQFHCQDALNYSMLISMESEKNDQCVHPPSC